MCTSVKTDRAVGTNSILHTPQMTPSAPVHLPFSLQSHANTSALAVMETACYRSTDRGIIARTLMDSSLSSTPLFLKHSATVCRMRVISCTVSCSLFIDLIKWELSFYCPSFTICAIIKWVETCQSHNYEILTPSPTFNYIQQIRFFPNSSDSYLTNTVSPKRQTNSQTPMFCVIKAWCDEYAVILSLHTVQPCNHTSIPINASKLLPC